MIELKFCFCDLKAVLSPLDLFNLRLMNLKPPKIDLHLHILHKNNFPIRPVVTHSAYKLSCNLINIIYHFTHFGLYF